MSMDNTTSTINTSQTTPVLTISCSFNTYDGLFITVQLSNKQTARQLKKLILKELTNLSISGISSSSSTVEGEERIYVDSSTSTTSIQSTNSSIIHTDGIYT